jgi:xylulose-5-phosphate/fructose-6-phosphate phosphoketolase
MLVVSTLTPPTRSIDLDALVSTWNAANYLTVAQIYLQANPLLREPLRAEHIKPRLLGHWGTSPALSLIYVQLNRLIQQRDCDVLYISGPGHGGPAIVANVYLEGSYSEIYPAVSLDEPGLLRLVRQFSTPGGIPSHVSVPTPGSIHEGGELGYALVHAFGAVFDNPDLIAACVVGDGEAETGPLEGSWKGVSFLDPRRDGAVLPILQLNGYKISGPTVLGRAPERDVHGLLSAHGYDVHAVIGDEPRAVHEEFAQTLDLCYDRIREIQAAARQSGVYAERVPWPAIVLRTPKGWTGPKFVDGAPVEGTFRAHQVPLDNVRSNAAHLAQLEEWMRGYRPESLFDNAGAPVPAVTAVMPRGDKRMGASAYANGGRLLRPLRLPEFTDYAMTVDPGVTVAESTRRLGEWVRDIYRDNPDNFRLFCPDETNSNRLGAVFDIENRCFEEQTIPIDDHVSHDGRVMEVLSEHLCEGWLEGYLLTGRHGLFASYEAFAMVSASMTVQHAKWLEAARALDWRVPVAALNVLLTSTCWRNDHNGFSHQGPGLIDTVMAMSGDVVRVYLPPDANCLLSVANHCLTSRNYVNLIVIDKQPELQYLTMDAAIEHCALGASVWDWASNQVGGEPDVVLGCAGDIPTLETLAAAALLRDRVPDLRFRLVNVVDLLAMSPAPFHPHALSAETFTRLFTDDIDVVMAFHGYARAFHQVVHGRPNAARFHVRGYNEHGTTTTPFDMVVLNEMSRYHLVMEALRRSRRTPDGAAELHHFCEDQLRRHHRYVREHFEDMPEIREWRWPG